MRKIIIIMMLILAGLGLSPLASAKTMIRLKIAAASKESRYFLCIYGVGCLNLAVYAQGKTFYTRPTDMGNIKKFIILDGNTMRMYKNSSNATCNHEVNDQQTLTLSGSFTTSNNGPQINNLRCAISD